MSSNIVVPALGESVTEATVAKWMKQQGESIAADEALVELETDKVTLEVFAPSAGVLSEIRVAEGQTVEVGAVLPQGADVGAQAIGDHGGVGVVTGDVDHGEQRLRIGHLCRAHPTTAGRGHNRTSDEMPC